MFVAIAEPVSNDANLGAIGVHFGCEAANPHVAIGALLARDTLRIGHRIFAAIVLASDEKLIAVLGLELGSTVSLIEVPLAIRSTDHGVEAVIVILSIESAESVLAFVHLRIELQVAIDIGVDDEVRRLSHYDLITKHADAKRRDQFGILHENMGAIGFTVLVRVLKNDDAVTFGTPVSVFAIIDSLRDPDPSLGIGIHVCRVEEHRACGPSGHFEIIWRRNLIGRQALRIERVGVELVGFLGVANRFAVEDEEANGSGSEFVATNRASVVESDLGPEGGGAFGNLEPNKRVGMRAKSLGVFFSGDHHGATAIRFPTPDLAEGSTPIVSGEVESGAILHHNFRLDPARPVVARIAFTGNDQVEIALIECDLDGNQAFHVTTLQHPTLVKRLRADDLRQRWMREAGAEDEGK